MYQSLLKSSFVSVTAMFFSVTSAYAQDEETKSNHTFNCGNSDKSELAIEDILSATIEINPVYNADNPINNTGKKSLGIGAGIVIDTIEGTIVTNHHVVEGSDAVYLRFYNPNGVNFASNALIRADILGFDEETDIAVLKAPLPNHIRCIGTQDTKQDVSYLDHVYAIGHPLNLNFSIKSGIVSHPQRTGILPFPVYQIDLASQRGNSGGMLISDNRKFIGMVTSQTDTRGSRGSNTFVIPHDTLFEIAFEIVEKGHVERGSLGIEFTDMTYDQKRQNNTGFGVIVEDVGGYQGKQASVFTPGDIIQLFNGLNIRNTDDLNGFLLLSDPKDAVSIGFLSGGTKYLTDIRLQ